MTNCLRTLERECCSFIAAHRKKGVAVKFDARGAFIVAHNLHRPQVSGHINRHATVLVFDFLAHRTRKIGGQNCVLALHGFRMRVPVDQGRNGPFFLCSFRADKLHRPQFLIKELGRTAAGARLHSG